ncbi:hypothetical protein [Streptomyces sp. NPDC087437]|uniref:hypothetical protein n=1 Tax=Streptomyces sp. NPDC087437 TaxID=3365789 RepID=UPI00381C4C42
MIYLLATRTFARLALPVYRGEERRPAENLIRPVQECRAARRPQLWPPACVHRDSLDVPGTGVRRLGDQ